jgi:hypothetical protein
MSEESFDVLRFSHCLNMGLPVLRLCLESHTLPVTQTTAVMHKPPTQNSRSGTAKNQTMKAQTMIIANVAAVSATLVLLSILINSINGTAAYYSFQSVNWQKA